MQDESCIRHISSLGADCQVGQIFAVAYLVHRFCISQCTLASYHAADVLLLFWRITMEMFIWSYKNILTQLKRDYAYTVLTAV